MKNKPTNLSDFFSRYQRARTQMYVIPAILGIMLATGIVSMAHTTDMRGLMASVAQVATPQYDADLVMTRTASGIEIRMGKSAQRVDTIELRLLTDPNDKVSLSSTVGTIVSEGEGVFQFVRSFSQQNIAAGTVITTFSGIVRDAPVALTDTEFISEGVRYSLTSK